MKYTIFVKNCVLRFTLINIWSSLLSFQVNKQFNETNNNVPFPYVISILLKNVILLKFVFVLQFCYVHEKMYSL